MFIMLLTLIFKLLLNITYATEISVVAKVIIFRGFLMAIALWGTSLWVKSEVDVADN